MIQLLLLFKDNSHSIHCDNGVGISISACPLFCLSHHDGSRQTESTDALTMPVSLILVKSGWENTQVSVKFGQQQYQPLIKFLPLCLCVCMCVSHKVWVIQEPPPQHSTVSCNTMLIVVALHVRTVRPCAALCLSCVKAQTRGTEL